MSEFGDYQGDMTMNRTLDERTTEALLAAGRAPYGRQDLTALASLITELRAVGDGAPPEPNAALAGILTYGLLADLTTADSDLPMPARHEVVRPVKRVSGLPTWKRVRTMISSGVSAIAMKVAALGVAAKASLVLTGTAAVAAGAVAADVPQAVNDALDRGEQHAPASSEPADAQFGAGGNGGDIEVPDVGGPAAVEDVREQVVDDAEETENDPASEDEGAGDNTSSEADGDLLDQAGETIDGISEQVPLDVPGELPVDVPEKLPVDIPGKLPVDIPGGVGGILP